MKKIAVSLFFLFFASALPGQSVAWQRATTLGKGMNLSWLEKFWEGTAEAGFSDYLNLNEISRHKSDLELMKEMGITTLRLPVCFDVWEDRQAPFEINRLEYFAAIDSILLWSEQMDLKVIIDYQHGTLTQCNIQAAEERLKIIWEQIAERYHHTDPANVFFELYNEPHDITAKDWQQVASQLVQHLRPMLPMHTFIVGGVNYNGIAGLKELEPLADDNIIYTFHFYEPFIFTHQGANWVGSPVATTRIPFPYDGAIMPPMSSATAGTFGEDHYHWYFWEGQEKNIRNLLQVTKDWSLRHNLPILCGEWGSHYLADRESRCRHAQAMIQYLQELAIPHCYWEWNRNFSFFEGRPSFTNLPTCMEAAWNYEIPKAPATTSPDLQLLFANPIEDQLLVRFPNPDDFHLVRIYQPNGQLLARHYLGGTSWTLKVNDWPSGLYLLQFENMDTGQRQVEKVWKN